MTLRWGRRHNVVRDRSMIFWRNYYHTFINLGKVVEQQRRAQASASVAQQQDQQMRQIQHFRQLQMQQFQQFLMQQQQHSSPVPMPTSTSPGANSSFQRMQSLQPHLLQQQFSSTMDNSGISTAAATSMMVRPLCFVRGLTTRLRNAGRLRRSFSLERFYSR